MKYKIVFTESYQKRAVRFFRKHKDLLGRYQKVLELLEANPSHPSLRMHALQGNLKGLYSVSINLSYRITLEFYRDEDEIIPIDIGSHDQIY